MCVDLQFDFVLSYYVLSSVTISMDTVLELQDHIL